MCMQQKKKKKKKLNHKYSYTLVHVILKLIWVLLVQKQQIGTTVLYRLQKHLLFNYSAVYVFSILGVDIENTNNSIIP